MWTPEEMFVGSVELCHMHTFLTYATRREMHIVSYESHANGVLECIDNEYRFTRIVIFPTIVVRGPLAETAEVHALLRETERHCLVANSIASIIEVSPTIIVQ
jgi:organic hydroperoxide reductase OsmC/OhrA